MKTKGIINYGDTVVFSPTPCDEDYELIKAFTTSDIEKEKLYVYKVKLCDNNIDRDNERFTHNALEQMRELFVGKVGILDHDPHSSNNHSRIYKTELIIDESIRNDDGDPYEYLLGYAYTVNTEKNADFITEIESGIKKEVSVGISVKRSICSICQSTDSCDHVKGNMYDGKPCFGLLDDVDDVYEWSFVSIPAQRKAGVIKSKTIENKEETVVMCLKDFIVSSIKSLNISKADEDVLLGELASFEDASEKAKSLESENAELSEKLAKALSDLEESKLRKLEEHVDRIIDGMKPKNDKMRALARRAIEEFIAVDDDGAITDEADKRIRDELESDEYRPLFETENTSEMETSDDEKACGAKDDKSKSFRKNDSKFEFTRSNTSKSFQMGSDDSRKFGFGGTRFVEKH